MVQEIDVECLGRFPQLAGHRNISGGRRGIAGGVIVGRDNGGGIGQNCRPKDLPRMGKARC